MTCIVRTPLLDPERRILGYKLAWQRAAGPAAAAQQSDLRSLAACAARPYASRGTVWAGDGLLFLEASPGLLPPDAFAGLAPSHTVLSLSAAALAEPPVLETARMLREAGYSLSVRDLPGPELPPEWLPFVSHVEFDWGQCARARALPVSAHARAGQPRPIATGLASWDEYQASAALGLGAFVDGAHASEARIDGRLSPQSLLVMQLMQMVQSNVDVRHIEAALRRDPALAFQLLRHLNSASFGFGVEVQSLRHGVAMMGYGPLYRWLAVLLANSSVQPAAPVLMQAAVIRGRFTELLGQGMLPPRDAENLFVAGMFSLLDRLLGVPITEVLDRIQLPAAVVQALLSRDGMYGPFVRLAEACESRDGNAAAIADAAFLTTAQVNAAHAAALAWAMELRA
jgi:EAL and modified HD-GYP domain-containing signal transduction protein